MCDKKLIIRMRYDMGTTLYRFLWYFLNHRIYRSLFRSCPFLVYPLYFSIRRSIEEMVKHINSLVLPFNINHKRRLELIPWRNRCPKCRQGMIVRHIRHVIGSRVGIFRSKPMSRFPLAIGRTGSLFHRFVPSSLSRSTGTSG